MSTDASGLVFIKVVEPPRSNWFLSIQSKTSSSPSLSESSLSGRSVSREYLFSIFISLYLYLYIHLLQPKQHLPGGLDPDVVNVEEGHKDHRPAGEGEDGELFEAGYVVEDEAGEEVGEGEGEEEHDCHSADMLEVVEDNQASGQAGEGKAG